MGRTPAVFAGFWLLSAAAGLAGCGRDSSPDLPTLAIDLRFRGVGQPLGYLGSGFFGAQDAYTRGTAYTVEGAFFGLATLDDDTFGVRLLAARGMPWHVTALIWENQFCPEQLEDAVGGNALVLGLGGNPTERRALCTLMTVKQRDGRTGPRYQYLHRLVTTTDGILQRLQADETSRSMVVTAISEVGALYTVVAAAVVVPAGMPVEQFETRIETPALAEVGARAEALSAEGFVITASTWTGGSYALVGTRPVGSTAQYTAKLIDSTTSDAEIAQLVRDGYAPVSFTSADLPDGTRARKVIGQKPR